ncbi:amidohydrolase family protein [Streptomyces sp. NEAU-YJ-81]|uniref:N-acyl-D-amino-acid deacylase family protein n=1 Tax=Streptomyces sp. NEAU-YJ-81 TaxID=2820288 RepID=UPI001ABC90F3|nr:amidohydrolase family protein [Streptomyces sp. NEAU-YJ-81]MBO3681958.1 amidohydrolase family protein [Streptomyces sp. NEAU-YJ-81]
MNELLVAGASVVDGTGAPPFAADVLVRGERIEAVEPPGSVEPAGRRVLRAGPGQVLMPGFVDVHSHSDNAPLHPTVDPSKLVQGVTTEVVGNCGFSLAPVGDPHTFAGFAEQVWPPLSPSWRDHEGLFAAAEAGGHGTNHVPLVGHGTLWTAADGDPAIMRRMLREALAAGCFGMSTGLAYAPGAAADTGHLLEVSAELGEDDVYATHLRSEGAGLDTAVEEALTVGRTVGCRVQISHIKASGPRRWGRLPAVLERLDSARDGGLRVGQDVYPYIASSTMLSAALPPWAHEGGTEGLLARLADPAGRAAIRAAVEGGEDDWDNHVDAVGYEGITVASTASGTHDGLPLPEVADRLDCDPFEALVRVVAGERNRANMIVECMDPSDVAAALRHPHTTIGTDAAPPGFGGHPHPRAYGTFPRVLGRYVREERLLTLPEAVAAMTSRAADAFGLGGRGRVVPGAFADLVLLDPAMVADLATYRTPVVPPTGVHTVLIAGREAVRAGMPTGLRAGRRLEPLR